MAAERKGYLFSKRFNSGFRARTYLRVSRRAVGRPYPNGTRATFSYEEVGNRTQMQDTTGRYTFSYAESNRYRSVAYPVAGIATYSFDALGQRSSLLDPDSGRFTYSYDSAGRLQWLENPQSDRTTFSYDAADRRTVTRLANGTRGSYTCDAADRLTQLFNLKSDDSVISGYDYTLDAADNRTAVLEATGERVTWSYDDRYQLVNERRSGAHAYNTTYTYDPVGNRLVKNASGALTTYAYDAANQLETSVDSAGVTTYTFDANGNQQVDWAPTGRTTHTWDYENRNKLVELPTGSRVTMAYHADFRRVRKVDDDGTTNFLWDTENDSYPMEKDAVGETVAIYTNEPPKYGKLISQRRGDTTNYYHFDGQGSTRQLTNQTAGVTDEYTFSAFGTTVATFGSTVNNATYGGGKEDTIRTRN